MEAFDTTDAPVLPWRAFFEMLLLQTGTSIKPSRRFCRASGIPKERGPDDVVLAFKAQPALFISVSSGMPQIRLADSVGVDGRREDKCI